ncbi:hypothetical protein [Hymenobacter psychrotolerans]|uniref:GDSL-like Lipase/Acylhydrolase n=1 Tax=Hymenobacter psychrotolerans DSM 18569 TaxID=1121959 RepID=A0A1M6TY44_9BACT|nr:hypothetical protein [Hymenobacter psychrotolerans]SHK61820.1 hypothetical protein SAMN02746009_01256 [Hymenobacter psychrotolerans DSM 18569]
MRIFSSSLSRTALPAVATVLLTLAGCSPDQNEPAPSSGNLNLTRYLAVGDSYTAGYADGGLTRQSQTYSYANMLANQFALVNPDAEFSLPLLEEGNGTGYLTLVSLQENGLPTTRRVPAASTLGRFINAAGCNGADTVYQYPRAATTLPQNLGVPGLRLTQIATPGLGNAANLTRVGLFNPYFERILPAANNSSYLQVVTAASPNATFFTFFAGLDDVLPYVVSGGSCGPLPSGSTMAQNARQLLTQLTANGRQGIIALPPALTTLPVLRLNNGLNLQERLRTSTNRPAYTLYVRAFNGAVQPVSGEDYILPAGQRRIGRLESTTGAPQTVPYGDEQNPVSGSDVLDYIEFSRINGAMTLYRDELRTLNQNTFKQPLIDVNTALFQQVADQINVNGVPYTSELVRGNFYSLDGYTLTPRGNALLANTFLRVINETYGANIPLLNVNDLPTKVNP